MSRLPAARGVRVQTEREIVGLVRCHLPLPARRALGYLLLSQPADRIDHVAQFLLSVVSRDGVRRIGEKVHKVAELLLRARNLDDLYRCVIATWKTPKRREK